MNKESRKTGKGSGNRQIGKQASSAPPISCFPAFLIKSISFKDPTNGVGPVFLCMLAAIAVMAGCAGCAQFSQTANHLAASPAGSTIVAKAADGVIQLALNAGASYLESNTDSGNPYVHAVADALRSNPEGIVDPVFVQKAFRDYGDPNNKTKFKTLARDVWALAKDAAVRFGKQNAAELVARGLQDGAMSRR